MSLFVTLWLSLTSIAAADAVDSWSQIHDGLLQEAAYGQLEEAGKVYERLVRNLPADDPVRAQALVHLGQVRYTLDDITGATDAFRECIRTGPERQRCSIAMNDLELEQISITKTPLHWTFDDTTHGFIHPWSHSNTSTIQIAKEDQQQSMLAWTKRLSPQDEDELLLGFSLSTSPSTLRVRAKAEHVDAYLRFLFLDRYGRWYTLPTDRAQQVSTTSFSTISVKLRTLLPMDATHPPLKLEDLSRLFIRDVTAQYSPQSIENVIFLDDFQLY